MVQAITGAGANCVRRLPAPYFFIDIAELRNSTEEAVFRTKENSENMVAS